jgi:hypothetical protein
MQRPGNGGGGGGGGDGRRWRAMNECKECVNRHYRSLIDFSKAVSLVALGQVCALDIVNVVCPQGVGGEVESRGLERVLVDGGGVG